MSTFKQHLVGDPTNKPWEQQLAEQRADYANFVAKAVRKRPLAYHVWERVRSFARPGESWKDFCERNGMGSLLGEYDSSTIDKIGGSKIPEIGIERLVKLCEQFNCTSDWLLFGELPSEHMHRIIAELKADPDIDIDRFFGVDLRKKDEGVPVLNPFEQKKRNAAARAEQAVESFDLG